MTTPNTDDFDALVAPLRRELHAYCYRMTGSLADAEDALQEALLGAWTGLSGFEGRSSLRSWLYRIATNACLRVIERRRARVLPFDYQPPAASVELEPLVEESVWLEPYPTPEDASYELLESVELAFVAALQHLPATQRAALVLCEVLGFSAGEVAELLDASLASVNSALQRARAAVAQRVPPMSQQATLKSLTSQDQRALVETYVNAWASRDVERLVTLLTTDVKFTMPPYPMWFDGRNAVARFFAERVFEWEWRLEPAQANGQLAFRCYQGPAFNLGALNVVTLRGAAIAELTGFLAPAVHERFSSLER